MTKKECCEKLLIMGCSIGSEDALVYAKDLGIYTIVTDFYSPEKNKLKLCADEYWMIDVADIETLEKKCREEGITGVFAATDEFCLDKTKELCGRLGLPFYASEEGWAAARNKEIFKQYCLECGLNVPQKYEIDEKTLEVCPSDISWPVIVKPVDSTAQRGLSICNNKAELEKGYKHALEYSKSKKAIIEEYIEGMEMGVGYIFDQGTPVLVEVCPYVCANVNGRDKFVYCAMKCEADEDYLKAVGPKVENLFRHMHCMHGTAFIQIKKKGDKYYFIEMNYRLDGSGSWYIGEQLKNENILKYLVDYALGHEPKWKKTEKGFKGYNAGGTYGTWTQAGKIAKIEGVEKVKEMEGVRILFQRFREGDIIPDTVSMDQMSFYICIVAENEEKIKEKLQKMKNILAIYNEEGENMLIWYGI